MEMGGHIYLIQPDGTLRAAWFHLFAAFPQLVVRGFAVAEEFADQVDALPGGCVLIDWTRTDPMTARRILVNVAHRRDMQCFIVAAQLSLAEVRALLRAGVRDLFRHPLNGREVCAQLAAALGAIQMEQQSARTAAQARYRLDRLTPRERAILAALAEGLSNKHVARRFDLSPRTVEVHRANMLRRADAASLAELLRLQILSEQMMPNIPAPHRGRQ